MTAAGSAEKGVMIMKGARVFTATRIVALAVIGVLVVGLVYLGLGGEESVSVPAGAKAGDLILHDCTYPTEAGDLPADCGTLVVAENASEPGSRLIALPIVRIRARSDDPGEPIFRLQGGPGISNMPFLPASRYAVDRDFVLVGYRGVDGSQRLECPEVVSAVKHSTDLTGEASFQAFAAGFRACAARFADEGIDVTSYGLAQRVDDLEAAREALSYERINLVSESVGTRTAMIYAWRYPERVNRSVMIAANPPGNFVWDPETTDEQIARYAEYCSKDAGVSRAHRRLRGDDALHEDPRAMALPPDRRGQRSGRLPLRTDGIDGGGRAAPCPDDDRRVVVRGRGRPKRVLVPVAAGGLRLPDGVRLGRVRERREPRCRGGEGVLRVQRRSRVTRTLATRRRRSGGEAAG